MTGPKQVSVRLVTSLGPDLRVPEAQLAVPAEVTRYGLSTIINQILKMDPPRVFDILLQGELLRDTLGEALLAKCVSTESAVVLEYTLLAVPPQLSQSAPQTDWIRGVACMPGGWMCTATAEGNIAVHNVKGLQIRTAHAHDGGAFALCMLPGTSEATGGSQQEAGDAQQGASCMVLSGGQDCACHMWRVSDAGLLEAALRLDCHSDSVSAVAATSSLAATGGWDNTIHLWAWRKLTADAAAGDLSADTTTKRKASAVSDDADESAPEASTPGNVPVISDSAAALQGHAQAVTGLAWAGTHSLMSSSMDHTLRRWDSTTGSAVDSISTGKALMCCASSAPEGRDEGGALVATGATDGTLRWWDCRAGAKKQEAQAIRAYKAHAAPVAAVAWRPQSEHHVASASLDGVVKLWDSRSALPLATLDDAQGLKLSAVAWGSHNIDGDGSLFIVTGGEDAVLRQYDVPDVGVRVES